MPRTSANSGKARITFTPGSSGYNSPTPNSLQDLLQEAKEELETDKYNMHTVLKALIGVADRQVQLQPELTKITEIEKKVDTFDTKFKKMEVEKASRSLIIKGLPLHPKSMNRTETRMQTIESCSNLLKVLNIQNEVIMDDAYRFPAKKDKKGALLIPSIKLSLCSKIGVNIFMQSLSKLTEQYQNVKISREIPEFLMPKNATLEKTAYEWRKGRKGRKTVITIRQNDLVLLGKEPTDKRFSIIEIE